MDLGICAEKNQQDKKILRKYEKKKSVQLLRIILFNIATNVAFRRLYIGNDLYIEILKKLGSVVIQCERKAKEENLIFKIDLSSNGNVCCNAEDSKTVDKQYILSVKCLRFILCCVEDIGCFQSTLLNFLDSDINSRCKIEILKIIYLRIDSFVLDFNFFFKLLSSCSRPENSVLSSYKMSKMQVLCIKIMTLVVNENTNIDFSKIMELSKLFMPNVNVELLILYSRWYFMTKKTEDTKYLCKSSQSIHKHQRLTEKIGCFKKKCKISVHETNLISLIEKCIIVDANCAAEVLIKLCKNNPEVQKYMNHAKKIKNILISQNNALYLYSAYEMSTFSECNRGFFQKHMSKRISELIMHKIGHAIFDDELLGALKLYKLFSRKSKMGHCALNEYPILEVCLLILSHEHKNTHINNETLCIVNNLLLSYHNSRKVFLDNDGFSVIMRHMLCYKSKILSICRNYLYGSTYQEKEAFIRNMSIRQFSSIFDHQQIENIGCIFNIYRNLFSCSEDDMVKLLNYLGIEGFPIELVNITMNYYDIFVSNTVINKNVFLNIIYTLVNLCILSHEDKKCVLALNFRDAIRLNDKDVNLALIWLLINVTWNNHRLNVVDKISEKKIEKWISMIKSSDEVINEKKKTLLNNLYSTL